MRKVLTDSDLLVSRAEIKAANLSSTSVESWSPKPTDCPYNCYFYGGTQNLLWGPEIFSRTVVTEIVEIRTIDGHLITSTSMSTAGPIATPNWQFTQSGYYLGQGPGAIQELNETTVVLFPALTITWPTAVLAAFASQLTQHMLTTENEKTFCTYSTTSWPQSEWPVWYEVVDNIFLNPGLIPPVPESYYSAWGVLTPSLCTPQLGGVPSRNVPVLDLTATTTVTVPELFSGPNSLGSSGGLSSQTSVSRTPKQALPATTTRSNTLITPPPSIPFLSPEDHSQPEASVIQPPKVGEAEVSPSYTQSSKGSDSSHLDPDLAMSSRLEMSTDNGGPKAPGIATIGGEFQPIAGTTLIIDSSGDALAGSSNDGTITIGGLTYTRGPEGGLSSGTQTVLPGAPAVVVSGTLVSLAASGEALIVGSSTHIIPTLPSPLPKDQEFQMGGFNFAHGPGLNLVVDTQTLSPGAPAIMVSGTPISLADLATAMAIGGSTFPMSGPPSPSAFTDSMPPEVNGITTIGGLSLGRGLTSGFVVGSQTVKVGEPAITVGGTPISLAASATAIVIGGSTVPLSYTIRPDSVKNSALPGIDAITVGGLSLSRASNSDLVIGSQTIEAGAPAITVDGTLISLAAAATVIVLDGSTIPISYPATKTEALSPGPGTVTIGDLILSRGSNLDVVVGPQTIKPGAAAVTVNSRLISLGSSGTSIVVDGSTIPIPLIGPTKTPFPLQINSATYTATSGSELVIGSQTLIVGGPAATVDGMVISLVPKAIQAEGASQALGDVIMSAFSYGAPAALPAATNGTGPAAFVGDASRFAQEGLGWVLVGLVLGCIVPLWI
ncbi:MAG: hypothetical protein Q9221_005382 [Calogaya cf. arnoldii]